MGRRSRVRTRARTRFRTRARTRFRMRARTVGERARTSGGTARVRVRV